MTNRFKQRLIDLAGIALHCSERGRTATMLRLKDMRDLLELIEYEIRYKPKHWTPTEDSDEIIARRCSVAACQNGPTLYNILAGRPGSESDWRCLQHIPAPTKTEWVFPVGLHGEDFLKSGRKIPKDSRDK